MFLLKKLLSAWMLPPVGLLVFALSALLIGKRGRGNTVALISILLTLLLSLPFVSEHLSSPLEETPVSISSLGEAQVIVILGGGTRRDAVEYGGDTVSRYSLERVRYGAKLARQSGLPILVTGGSVYGGRPEAELMRQVLTDELAQPVRWVETQSRDTNENALLSAVLLRNAGIQRIALVTHAWHMTRAIKAFEKQSLKVIPAATGFTSQGANLFERLLPSAAALEQSAISIHEWAGLLLVR